MRWFVLWSLFTFRSLLAAEPQADPADLPRIPPTEPGQARATFELRPGLRLVLAAHEPLVEDPIAACFNADGHLFVVEMRGYSERREEKRGRIRLLVDEDDDGRFDRATVYAEGLRWPTAVQCFDGGVFVIATPDLLWFKDRDGDGVADEKKVLFTGFGQPRLNVQGLANSLRWGPDNRIWGATAHNGGKVQRAGEAAAKAVNLRGSDFSFDPRLLDLRAENGTAQYGLSFDAVGRRYVSSNSKHLMAVLWERSWTRSGGLAPLPPPLQVIAVDGGAAPVFRISGDEPWRIVRTRWRVAGLVRGPVEGGGRVSGYFTGASAVNIYTGDALGPAFAGNAFIGDVGSNLLHRKRVQRDGGRVLPEAHRPDDERDREFLASRDNWFRPTESLNAPDGCLYVIDMYREIIEHPWSLPPGIKRHLDLNSGNTRGRIYRIEPERFRRRSTRALSQATNDALAELMDHPNGWHRVTAQRLLWERGDARAAGGWGRAPEAGSAEARYRQALALTREAGEEKTGLLAALTQGGLDDPWLRAAVLNAISTPAEAAALFAALPVDSDRTMLVETAGLIGRSKDQAAAQQVLGTLRVIDQGQDLALALAEGLAQAGSSLAEVASRDDLAFILTDAVLDASHSDRADADRLRGIRLCAQLPGAEISGMLTGLFKQERSSALQVALMDALARHRLGELPALILARWEGLDARARAAALNHLLSGKAGVLELLAAMESGSFKRDELPSSRLAALRKHRDGTVKRRVAQLFPQEQKEPRTAVIARYAKALSLKGDAAKGRAVYEERCMACHRFGKQGFPVGPDLVTFKAAGPDSLLSNMLDPNREVAPQYQAYTFRLKAGGERVGLIAHETTTQLTIRESFGKEQTFKRTEIAGMSGLGISLMPEGLEAGLSVQDLADLLEFVRGE